MEQQQLKRCPIGVQTFEKVIEGNYLYIDKKKELFKGFAIEKLETEWTEYPVLHFDMSLAKYVDKETLESMLDVQLFEHEKYTESRKGRLLLMTG